MINVCYFVHKLVFYFPFLIFSCHKLVIIILKLLIIMCMFKPVRFKN